MSRRLPRLPRRDPDHGGGGMRGHRQHGLLLGAAARAEPRGLLHDKAAIASLTQCLGMDHARQGIRVNAVCPNEVNTPMLRAGLAVRGFDPDTALAELGKSVPLGRIAEPADIADVVLFLVSDEACYMCGSLVEVNGGKPVV